MKVSVIIPVYNVERYLARCLDSVIAAAVGEDVEIICIDDGSTDGSPEILKRYADRVRIFTKENGGQSSARNLGIDVAVGEYVMFVDSDDFIPKNGISAFVRVASESGAPLVVSTSFWKDMIGGGFESYPKSSSLPLRWRFRRRDWICGRKVQYSVWNKFFGIDLVRNRRFLPVRFEDFAYMTEVFCDLEEFAVIDEPLYVYNTNADGSSTIHSAFGMKKLEYSFVVVRDVLEYAKGKTCWRFALRQAADGLSSTVGKVYKSHGNVLKSEFRRRAVELFGDFPELSPKMSLKAKFRMWRMK